MIRAIWLDDEKRIVNLEIEKIKDVVDERDGVLWVDIESPTPDEFTIMESVFEFHPLALQDVREDAHYAKFEDFGDVLLITAQTPYDPSIVIAPETDERTKEIDIFIGRNFLVTSHKRSSPTINAYFTHPIANGVSILDDGADMMAQKLLETVLTRYDKVVDELLLRSEALEDSVMLMTNQEQILQESLDLKKIAMTMRRTLGYHRDIFWNLTHKNFIVIRKRTQNYFRNIYDHVDQLNVKLDLCRETLTNARDLHLSLTSKRTNDVMRVLAVVSTIVMPLTFLTGLFGMNYVLPGNQTHDPIPFWTVIGVMTLLALGMVLAFRMKKWL